MTRTEWHKKYGHTVTSAAVAKSKRSHKNAIRRNAKTTDNWMKKYTGRVAGPRKNERTMPVGSPDGTDPAIRAAKTSA